MGAMRIAVVIPASTSPLTNDAAMPNGERRTLRPRCHLRGIVTLAGALLLFVALAMAHPLTAFAATVTVTTTADSTNACAGSGNGTCSLRDAVTFANNNDSTTIAFSLANPSTITLTGGTLTLTRTTGSGTTITGPGSAALAVDGNNAVTVITVNSGVTASISGVTIQNANPGNAEGGGIANSGILTVTNSTLFHNSAFLAGGINNESGATLVLIGSTLSGNTATNPFPTGPGGGGIRNSGTATVTNSTFTGNTALHFGGGIDNAAGTLTVTNSTLSGNTSTVNSGGGITTDDPATLTITNTIVTGNIGGDLDGPSSGGNNLIGGPALLAPLGNYGGPTQTMALLPGSPAIDAGNDSICITTTGTAPVHKQDQRGTIRPQGAHCDIGAFESQGFTIAITGGDPQTGLLSQPFANPLAVSVTSSNSEPVNGGAVTFTVNPVGGAGATLTGNPATITGGAASVTAQANGTAGSYTVTAAASGASVSRTFHLTNVAVALVVNNTGDGAAVSLNCAAGNASTCRLRDAVALVDAGATSGNTTITFALPNPSTITLDGVQGTLNISASMTITGPGAGALTISGNNAMPVIIVGDVTTISGVTIAGGKSTTPGFGGGITNNGSTLTVMNCTFSGNSAPSGSGGGIASSFPGSTLTVTNSTFTNNSAAGGSGGGIAVDGSTLTVANSTFSGNSATTGGAIASHSLALTVAVTNSTFSGNTASGSGSVGGGIANNGFLTVTSSTFSANTASGSGNAGGGIYNAINNAGALGVTNSTLVGNAATTGGGVANSGLMAVTNSTLVGNSATTGGGISAGGTLSVTNTIVSGNTGGDVSGSPTSSHNLIGGSPLLSALGNHGGPTQTFALLPGSPAIDAGDDTICQDMHLIAPVAGLDQRGVSRSQGAHCDIGAFEYAVPNTLPGAKAPGGGGGSPGPMPGSRPNGPTGGAAPNPIPVSRP